MEELIEHHDNDIINLDNVIKTNRHEFINLTNEINHEINDVKNELDKLKRLIRKSDYSIPVIHLTFESKGIDHPNTKNIDNKFISSLQPNMFGIQKDGVYIIDINLRSSGDEGLIIFLRTGGNNESNTINIKSKNQGIIKKKVTRYLEEGTTLTFQSSGVFNEGSFIKMNYI